jgi:putative ABC transport system permease protein
MPGVEAVGFMDMLPLMGERGHLVTDRLEGYVVPEGGSIEFGHAAVSPDCFRALGIPLVEGREITESDLSAQRPVALVNESFARRFWPNQTVLGKRLERLHKSYEIVGIVRDARLNTLVQMPEPTIFFVTGADEAQNPNFILRTRGDPKSLLKPIIAELTRVHPGLRGSHVTSLRQFMRERLSAQRQAMTLLGRLAALALALTVLGVYGMMSFVVTQRTREIGIRIAVGAGRADVARLILLSGFGVALAGVGIGLPLALGGASLLRHVVYGVNAFDLPAFGAAAVLVLFAILLACWLPARRASKVDPMVALRHE